MVNNKDIATIQKTLKENKTMSFLIVNFLTHEIKNEFQNDFFNDSRRAQLFLMMARYVALFLKKC